MCNGNVKCENHGVEVNGNSGLLNNDIDGVVEYANIQTGEVLDLDKVNELKDNAMLKVIPSLWCVWDFKKNDELGYDIWKMTKKSNKKAWWVCMNGHSWDTKVCHRTSSSGCPYCSNQKILIGFNDLHTSQPKISTELLNKEDGYKYSQGSSQKVDWKCGKNHIWKATISSRVNGTGCPYCSGNLPTEENNLLVKHRELCSEWDYNENKKLPEEYLPNSNKKVHWICSTCTSNYEAVINTRVNDSKIGSCLYCRGVKVNDLNCLANNDSRLASQWHPTKNGDLTPNDVAVNSGQKVWWMCGEGHEWECEINRRTRYNGSNCPTCSNQQILVGYNDIWTTNPEIASLLLNKEDGYLYSKGSNVKLDWKCTDCRNVIHSKSINDIRNKGVCCPNCSDGFKYPEKVMYYLLRTLNVDFKHDTSFKWSNGKRYDFYIPSLKLIIETHGGQHSITSFENLGGRTLEEEQENDQYKYEMAIANGIDNYIAIDCRYSEINYIVNNILNSELISLFDLSDIDWDAVDKNAKSSLHKEIINMFKDGTLVKDIAKDLSINYTTVYKVLKRNGFESRAKENYIKERYHTKIHQYTKTGDLIKIWDGFQYIIDCYGFNKDKIKYCCEGKQKSSYGFIWKYETDLIA